MFTDTHAHLTDRYTTSAADIVARAANAGVGRIICACADPDDPAAALSLADAHDNVYVTIGIHPEYAATANIDSITPYINHPRVVGIGEIGLDYHPSPDGAAASSSARCAQMDLFRAQLELAAAHNLPVAIHTRDAEDDTAKILSEFPTVRGVMHCFTGTYDFAKKMLDRGFYIAASGIITFKNSAELRDTFAQIPLNRIVIETDSPWCAPVPFRGKQAEPAMVVETAKTLAELHKLDLPELAVILEDNTKKLYPRIK